MFVNIMWAEIVQWVQRLTMVWTVRGSKPEWEEICSTCPERPWGPHSLLHNGYRFCSLEAKRPGFGFDHPPHLASRIKKE
jgi:hypothetical protein